MRGPVDPTDIGVNFEAIIHVHLTRHRPERLVDFIRPVETCTEVQECYATTGQADYHVGILCRDLAAYNVFLGEFLFRLSAVASAQINVVLRTIKRNRPVVCRRSGREGHPGPSHTNIGEVMQKLIQTCGSPEGGLIWLQLLSVGIVGFRKIDMEMNDPFQCCDDQDEFYRCTKKREYGDRPHNMHSRMLCASHMEIRASPR